MFSTINIGDIVSESMLTIKRIFSDITLLIYPFIDESDCDAGVEEGQFTQTMLQ